jgi:hypothetical protein
MKRRPCLQSATSEQGGLDLPIDHFRLLGVNPATDVQAVLHTLQQRLDRTPDQGFRAETLEARAELLRASADLLSDADRRAVYEASLTTLAAKDPGSLPTLEIPSSRDVGGLLLLLEAGQAHDCFELAQRNLQPPHAPALGSGREADLALLAGLACLAAAADLHQQRRYEAAAQTLMQGQQLLQRTGQQPKLRQQMEQEMNGLQPYRVLDLLSRDLGASGERSEGLALLDALVQRRGGLEGNDDPRFPAQEFQAFFKQIRGYLTVQEQVDLFTRWGADSRAAAFLATTALSASGFARRKPEQLVAALERLRTSDQAGTQPLQACLQMLLGRVDEALYLFQGDASPELRLWAQLQGDDPLSQLCAYCSDWLGRDVLPGYRDLEADPDLEAWFADRDVQAFVEQHDPAPLPAQPERSGGGLFGAWMAGMGGMGEVGASAEPAPLPLPAPLSNTYAENDPEDADETQEVVIDWGELLNSWLPRWPLKPRRPLAVAALVVALAAAGGALLLRNRQGAVTPLAVQPAPQAAPTGAPPASQAPAFPLTSPEPSEKQLQALLEGWLAAKSAVLAGQNSPTPLADLARAIQVSRLEQERQADAAQNQTQRISASVRALAVEERSLQRIAVVASLDYSDQRLNAAGKAVGRPTALQLRNRYVFARDDERWLLASFQKAD